MNHIVHYKRAMRAPAIPASASNRRVPADPSDKVGLGTGALLSVAFPLPPVDADDPVPIGPVDSVIALVGGCVVVAEFITVELSLD